MVPSARSTVYVETPKPAFLFAVAILVVIIMEWCRAGTWRCDVHICLIGGLICKAFGKKISPPTNRNLSHYLSPTLATTQREILED